MSGLVGASYGSWQAVNVALQAALVEEAQAQRDHLGAQMPAREVAVCLDETFDPAL